MSESIKNQLKKTATHSAIYAVGTILRRITGLVMLPIYTRYLTPEDYGAVELLAMAIEIASILIGLRISQALFVFYIQADDAKEKSTIVSTVLTTVIMTSIIGSALLIAFSTPLAHLLFGTLEYELELKLFAFTLMTQAIVTVGLSYLRVKQMPIAYVVLGAIMLAIQVTMNIIFVVIQELHVTGVVYSALISGGVVSVLLAAYVYYSVGFSYSLDIFKKLFNFVSPLILASLGTFYVLNADKTLLRIFSGLGEVGLYALAGRVSAVLFTFFDAFNMSWEADRFEISKRSDATIVFNRVFKYMSAILVLLASGMCLFVYDLFRIMTAPEFYSAANIVPILVAAMFLRIYSVYFNFGILYSKQTKYIAYATVIKAITSTLLWVALIPPFGAIGAAVALMISNLIEVIWIYKKSEQFYKMGIDWSKDLVIILPVFLCMGLSYFRIETLVEDFIKNGVIFVGILFLLYWLPVWSLTERATIKDFAITLLRGRNPFRKI